jgi:hypothetical protein
MSSARDTCTAYNTNVINIFFSTYVVCVQVAELTSRPLYLCALLLHEEDLEGTEQEENPVITDYHITYCRVWNLKLLCQWYSESCRRSYGAVELSLSVIREAWRAHCVGGAENYKLE